MASETEEEMVETEEDDEGSSAGGSGSSCSTPPSAPVSQKPPPSSASSNCSPSSDPFRRKTRYLPNICNCHSCGLRFPDRGRRERLEPLDSQWRIVLLCRACLRAIRSADVCSYCFAGFGEEKEGGIRCRRCSARVHLGCVPQLRGFLAASDLDPDLFVCIDCCALPRSPMKKLGNARDSCATRAATVSLEEVVRSAKRSAAKKLELAERAKKKALAKAVAAKCAAQLARSALGLVIVGEKKPLACTPATVTDEKLTLQHLTMNSSRRILRNLYPDISGRSTDCNRGRSSNSSVNKASESVDCNIYGKVELCTEDTLSETMEDNHHVHTVMREGIKETSKGEECNSEEIAQREEQGSCSHTLVDSTTDEKSVDSMSAPRPTFTSAFQREQQSSLPDRYLKKYCKRGRMNDKKQNGGSAPPLVPVGK